MKTLTDVQQDMSDLYEAVKDDSVELKKAGELANIAGKYLKAEQLKLAREIFTSHGDRGAAGRMLRDDSDSTPAISQQQ